jgi:hypothetical protein
MSTAAPPGLIDRLRALDPERYARRIAPAGVVACAAGVGIGGWPGLALAVVGIGLLLTSCVSRDYGLLVFGPFVRLELVRAACGRRPPAFWRALYAAAAFGLFTLTYFGTAPESESDRVAPADVLRRAAGGFFGAFAVLQFLYLAVIAVRLLAPVVAEERQSKRLDFVLTTDMRNREILLGKAAGRLPQLLDPVLASLPILALLPLFGGIPPEYAAIAAAATLATVLGIAGVAFFASVISPTRDIAISTANSLCVAYMVLSAVAYGVTRWPVVWDFPESVGVPSPVNVSDVILWAAAGNPLVVAPLTVMDIEGGAEPAPTVWRAVRRYALFHLGVGGVFGLMAAARLRAVVVSEPPSGLTPAAAKAVLRRSRPPVRDESVFWAEAYRHPPVARAGNWWAAARPNLVLGAVIVVLIHAAGSIWGNNPMTARWLVTLIAFLLAAGTVLTTGSRAAGTVVREKKADTLEALVLTGLGCREILRQKWRACALAPFNLYAVLAGIVAAGLVLDSLHPLAVLGLVVVFAPLVVVGTSLGLYASVRLANPNRAFLALFTTGVVVVTIFGRVVEMLLTPPPGKPEPQLAFPLTVVGVLWVTAGVTAALVLWELAVGRFEREWEDDR